MISYVDESGEQFGQGGFGGGEGSGAIPNFGAVADLLHRSDIQGTVQCESSLTDNSDRTRIEGTELPPSYRVSTRAHGYGHRAPSRLRNTTMVVGHISSGSTDSSTPTSTSVSGGPSGVGVIDLTRLSHISRRSTSNGTACTMNTVKVVRRSTLDTAQNRASKLGIVSDEPEDEGEETDTKQMSGSGSTDAEDDAKTETEKRESKKAKRAQRWKKTLSDLFSGRKESAGIFERSTDTRQASLFTPTAFQPDDGVGTSTRLPDHSQPNTTPRPTLVKSHSTPLTRGGSSRLGHHSNHSVFTLVAFGHKHKERRDGDDLVEDAKSRRKSAKQVKRKSKRVEASEDEDDMRTPYYQKEYAIGSPSAVREYEESRLKRARSFSGWAGTGPAPKYLQERPTVGEGGGATSDAEENDYDELDELTREAENVARRVGGEWGYAV
ncbi:hypothetical protein K435DRAFT_775814 [Dendrothele bispora CBS 962.96]|uniref:Uncharacterized protein n=1 Tax=Dendrothele bispora (strain CBS 962.96) TaxID=1314807 RepID=A0A4S8MIP2_DENBC|nr:hypothetical protein K435DRAFT_775814 [Dendrothele bispora CBS 962.96]